MMAVSVFPHHFKGTYGLHLQCLRGEGNMFLILLGTSHFITQCHIAELSK